MQLELDCSTLVTSHTPYTQLRHPQLLKRPRILQQRRLHRQPLHTTRPKKPMHPLRPTQHILRIPRPRHRTPMTQHNRITLNPNNRIPNLLRNPHTIIQRHRRLRPDRPRCCQSQMHNDHIRARPRHQLALAHVEDVRRGYEIELVREPDHLDFLLEAHACFFEVGAEVAVDQADGGEVLDADEAQGFEVGEEFGHCAEGVGAADAGEDGGVGYDGEDFVGLFSQHPLHVPEYVSLNRGATISTTTWLASEYGIIPANDPRPAMRNRPEL